VTGASIADLTTRDFQQIRWIIKQCAGNLSEPVSNLSERAGNLQQRAGNLSRYAGNL